MLSFDNTALKFICNRSNAFRVYGKAGHERGLVEPVSCFRCKKILKYAIVAKDIWFHNASEMTDFLKSQNSGPTTKEYYFVDETETARLM